MVAGVTLLASPAALGTAANAMWSARAELVPGVADEHALQAAADYDRRLIDGGSAAIGEAGASAFANGAATHGNAPVYLTDADYQSQLGAGDEMARILIPAISVDLPVGHGSSPALLESQAGHVYGTTLPVGDEGNSVIAAHRGLGIRPLFRRLGELGPDDMVYVRAAGATVAWRVESVWTVVPGSVEERRAVAVERGASLLTLYTCDPPGMNTRRLIVRARHDATGNAVPSPTEALAEDPAWSVAAVVAAMSAIAATVMSIMLRRGRRRPTPPRHRPPSPIGRAAVDAHQPHHPHGSHRQRSST